MNSTTKMRAAARRAHARADAAYQFAICLGLSAVAGFVGTAGAFVAHVGI